MAKKLKKIKISWFFRRLRTCDPKNWVWKLLADKISGWVFGWVDVKAVLWIAHSNKMYVDKKLLFFWQCTDAYPTVTVWQIFSLQYNIIFSYQITLFTVKPVTTEVAAYNCMLPPKIYEWVFLHILALFLSKLFKKVITLSQFSFPQRKSWILWE
jgi:hypothetical protein